MAIPILGILNFLNPGQAGSGVQHKKELNSEISRFRTGLFFYNLFPSAHLVNSIRIQFLGITIGILAAFACPTSTAQQPTVNPVIEAQAEKTNDEAIALADKGDLAGAIERFKQAQGLYHQAHNPRGEAKMLRNLGQATYLLGKEHKDEALEYFSQALPLYHSAGDRESEGQVLFRIGQVRYDTRDAKGALAAFDEAIPLLSKSWMSDNEAWLRSMMADCYYDSGNSKLAIETYKLVLTLPQASKDPNLPANITEQIGIIYLLEGNRAGASEYLKQAQKAWHDLKNPKREGGVLKSLAILSERLGDLAGAIANYDQARSMFHVQGLDRDEAEVLNLIGVLYATLGDPQRAVKYHTAAREVLRRTDERRAEASTEMQIAFASRDMDDYLSAREHLHAAFGLFKALNDSEGMASALFYLGLIQETAGEFSEALDYLNQALPLSRASKDLVNELRILGQIGEIYTRQGNKQKAQEIVAEEIAVSKAVTNPEMKAPLLMRIGINYVLLANDREAINYYQQALDLYRTMDNKSGTSESLAAIGAAYEFLGEFPNALKKYQESISIRDRLRTAARVEELQAGIAGQNASTYQYAARLAMQLNQPGLAFEFSERARARGLLDQLGNTKIDPNKSADPKIIEREQSLRAELTALERQDVNQRSKPASEMMGQSVNTAISAQTIASLQNEYEALNIQLKATNPEYVSMHTIDPLPVSDVQKLLDPDTTLVSYFITMDKTQAFIITGNSFQAVSLPVKEQDLKTAVSTFRGFANTGKQNLQNVRVLYDWLIKPLKPYLKTSLLGIVPHGVLHYLPFAALTDGNRYFGDEYQLFYLPSVSALPFIRQKRKADRSTLLSMAQSQAEGLPLLTYADQMAAEIAKLYGTAALTGSSATETTLRARAPDSGIIFLAAHGRFNIMNPLFSRIVLAADKENDGLLEVHEVYRLDLKKADLVVLSSCQTQLGSQSRGDDIVGLNRAFIYAGTPTVVASLWSVGERPTSELMIAFFKNLKNGMSKAGALQVAQAQTRIKDPDPYYWAAFVLTGEPK